MTEAKSQPVPWLVLASLRPRQWTKNLLLLVPVVFAKRASDPATALHAFLAFVSFCLLASGVYLLNDWLDRERDRLHPEKKLRPLASGALPLPVAGVAWAVCWGGGLAVAGSLHPEFLRVALAYLGLQVLYSLGLRKVVILDVVVIAAGFVLRVAGGGAAVQVPVSNWLYLCTLLLAVFLGFAKRRHEISFLQEEAGAHRPNLNEYSLPMLDQMISVVAASSILAYGLYTVSRDTVEHVGSDRLKFTVPFVIYGIFRYLFLIHKRGAGGSPEKVLLSDLPLIGSVVLFTLVAGWVLYFGASG